MEGIDYLLMMMTDPISMPGKCYEDLATGKPILAIAPPDSAVDRMTRSNGFGMCADPMDDNGLTGMLTQAVRRVDQQECLFAYNDETAREYAKRSLIGQYRGLIMGAHAPRTATANREIKTAGAAP
jgi:hypothetical protein